MEKCVISWWQEGWFITLIPIVSAILGWIFKTFWEYLKPYRREQLLFEEIKNIFDNQDDNFIENMKFFVVGNSISKKTLDKLHDLKDRVLQKPEYFFSSKKVQKAFQQLKDATNRYSEAFLEPYILNGNVFTLFKPHEHCFMEKKEEMEELYRKRNEELSQAQQDFEVSYDNFIKIAQIELYKEKVK